MPNWVVHDKWAKKAGIDEFIAYYVNRNIDYGTSWAFSNNDDSRNYNHSESVAIQQLRFFHQKDLEHEEDTQNSYVKACYLHHLLDYFRETRVNINDIDLVFENFLIEKIGPEIVNNKGIKISFLSDIQQIFDLLKKNKDDLLSDLRGEYLTKLDKKNRI